MKINSNGPTRERCILMVICVLTFGVGGILTAFGGYLAHFATHVNASALGLAILGGCTILVSIIGFCGAKTTRNWMLLCYFYINVFFIACFVLFSVAAIFFQESFEGWAKHNWDSAALELIQKQSCCQTYDDTIAYLEYRFFIVGIIGFISLSLLVLASYYSLVILTIPVAMKNMLMIINIMFMAIGSAIVLMGIRLTHHEEVQAGELWIAPAFILSGVIIFSMSMFGILGARSKNRSLLLTYIVGVVIAFLLLVICGILAFVYKESLAENYHSQDRGEVACTAGLKGCTNCTSIEPCPGVLQYTNDTDGRQYWIDCNLKTPERNCEMGKTVVHAREEQAFYGKEAIAECGKCPQWSGQDIKDYISASLQFFGLVAILVCIFLSVGIGGAVLLRRSLAGYQQDSI